MQCPLSPGNERNHNSENNGSNNRKNGNSEKSNNGNNGEYNNDDFGSNGNGGFFGGNGGDKKRENDDDDDRDKKQKKNITENKSEENEKEKKDEEENEDEIKEEIETKQKEFTCSLRVNAAEFIPNRNNKLFPIDEKQQFLLNDDEKIKEITNNGPKQRKPAKKQKVSDIQSNYSYDPNPSFRAKGNIKISKTFTNKNGLISNMIKEDINNLYFYMDKSVAFQNGKEINLKNGEKLKIINFDFHSKETDETLYCVLTPYHGKVTKFKWKMEEKLFSAQDIKKIYNISRYELPQNLRTCIHFQSDLKQYDQIKNVIMNKEKIKEVIDKTKWTKVLIKNRYHTKKRLTLSLNKKEFIKNLNALNDFNDVHLIPILMFDAIAKKNKFWVEYLWIITIDENINIGISLIYNTETDNVKVKGIHLDKTYIINQHQLVSPLNSSDCLQDIFQSNISDLHIGNPDDAENRINALTQRNYILKKENNALNKKIKSMQNDKKELIDLKQEIERIKIENEKFRTLIHSTSNPSTPSTDSTSISLSSPSIFQTQNISSSPSLNQNIYPNISHQIPTPFMQNNHNLNMSPNLLYTSPQTNIKCPYQVYCVGGNLLILRTQ